MVVGYTDKRGRKKEKEGRGFGRLPYFFFPPSLCVFSWLFNSSVVILVQSCSCFLCFEDSSGFEFLKFLIILLVGRWKEFELVVIRVRVQVSISLLLNHSHGFEEFQNGLLSLSNDSANSSCAWHESSASNASNSEYSKMFSFPPPCRSSTSVTAHDTFFY